MFEDIWDERPHVSFVSGKPLGDQMAPWMFAHVLPKGRYPHARLDKENIVLLTFKEHFLLDHGTIAQREEYAEESNANWDKLIALRDKLTQKYS